MENSFKTWMRWLLPALAAVLLWAMLSLDASAVIQLNDDYRPENLPTITEQEAVDEAYPETAATQSIIVFAGNLVSQVLLFAGAVTVIFLIVAGAKYILAFGKDERIQDGKRGIFWALSGLGIILLSYAIVQGVIGLLLQLDVNATT